MKKRYEFTQYQKAVQAYLDKAKSFSSLKNSKKLSSVERLLVLVRYLNRKGKHLTAQKLLENNKTCEETFLKAEKLFLYAQTYSFLGDFERSASYNHQALVYYEELEDCRGLFLTLYNLSVDYSRLNLKVLSKNYLNNAIKYADSDKDKALIQRALACHYYEEREYKHAIECIENALCTLKNASILDQLNTMVIALEMYFFTEKYDMALNLINHLAKYNDISLKNRYLLEKEIIHAIIDKRNIGKPPKDFEGGVYLLKWKLLYLIGHNDITLAKAYWDQVASADRSMPSEFLGDLGGTEDDIYFYYLNLLIKQLETPKDNPIILKAGKVNELYTLLYNAPTPLSKELIIEKIWKTSYSPEFDSRFYKLVQRLKNQANIAVLNQNSCYFLSSSNLQ